MNVASTTTSALADIAVRALVSCGVDLRADGDVPADSPITGGTLMSVRHLDAAEVDRQISLGHEAFKEWRTFPAPTRGALVKAFGRRVEEHRDDLADLIAIEVGKIRSEALGEIQEVIDICDFAVGLSRQLEGRTMPSERPGHRLMETWHPRGVVAVISAFNFPAAVWAWNTAIALVCGNSVVWKPSELTSLTSMACSAILDEVIRAQGAPHDIHQLAMTDRVTAGRLVDDARVAVVSATGSERMGREVAARVAARFGNSILELGGNNAAVVTESADLDLAVRGIVFAAAGTAGQRCTTMRRLIVHESIADELVSRIAESYRRIPVGDPLADGTLVGPLINRDALDRMQAAIARATAEGGELIVGGEQCDGPEAGVYVRPALVRMPRMTAVVREETFAPLLYVMTYRDLDEAISLHNDVPQGLSSSIFTLNQREAETFMSGSGSDCGIVNVNIGTSGAEIGGAFGGEKSTGGGRESGSDAWRAYMRRATNTVNYSNELPLAQGVQFA